MPQFEEVLKRRVPIVTTTEEAAYPAPHNRRLAKRLDEAARKAKVAVLGTGVNPGFVMDALPIALTAVCERVDRVEVHRVQDARIRRLPFQQKIGAGLTPEQFQREVDDGHRASRRLHRIDPDDCATRSAGSSIGSPTTSSRRSPTQPVASELLAVDRRLRVRASSRRASGM